MGQVFSGRVTGGGAVGSGFMHICNFSSIPLCDWDTL